MIPSLEGFELGLTLTLTDIPSQTKGTQNMILSDYAATCTFKPDKNALTLDVILAKMQSLNNGARIGGSVVPGDDFVISGPNIEWRLKKPFISQHSYRFTYDQLAEQGITLVATQAAAGGVAVVVTDIS